MQQEGKKHAERILIIGGSSGIGKTLADSLFAEGNDVIIASRNAENAGLEFSGNGKLTTFNLDAFNEEAVAEFAKRLGEIDHLVVTLRGKTIATPFEQSTTDEVREAFEGKFWPQYYLARHLLKNIKTGGSITLTSGIASMRSYKGFYWHAAANGAIEALVKSLAVEIAPVRINALSHGFTERHPNDTERYEIMRKVEPRMPLGRLATQAEIVKGYIYLMQNSYVTGSTLIVDGGTLCG